MSEYVCFIDMTSDCYVSNRLPISCRFFSALLSSLACTREETIQVPVRKTFKDLLDLDVGTGCDEEITICTAAKIDLDISTVYDYLDNIWASLSPLVTRIRDVISPEESFEGRRELSDSLPTIPLFDLK